MYTCFQFEKFISKFCVSHKEPIVASDFDRLYFKNYTIKTSSTDSMTDLFLRKT